MSCSLLPLGSYARDACERAWPGYTRRKKRKTMSLSYGDIKAGLQATDHNGWLKMDGRLVNTLSASQQNQAAILGIVGSIPDATDSVLLQKDIVPLGTIDGANETTITRDSLPDVTLAATTESAGGHSHTGSTDAVGAHMHTGTTDTGGNHTHTVTGEHLGNLTGSNIGYTGNTGSWSGSTQRTSSAHGGHSHPFTTSNAGGHSHALTVDSVTGHVHALTTESINGGVTQNTISIQQRCLSVNLFLYLGI